jgi:hypothetical protein
MRLDIGRIKQATGWSPKRKSDEAIRLAAGGTLGHTYALAAVLIEILSKSSRKSEIVEQHSAGIAS